MNKNIYFDMDGTIADLYSVPNWLEHLVNQNPLPYKIAKPMCNFSRLARKLNKLQKQGWNLGIISWCARDSTQDYNIKVTAAKQQWLKKHLPSIHWNEILICPYGTNKNEACQGGILFDDEEKNRLTWTNGRAYEPAQMFEVLNSLG